MALLDNGTQINTIMPGFIEITPWMLGLSWTSWADELSGLGNTFTWPIGYMIKWVEVDGVKGYDEDQIALIVPDLYNFGAQVPVILGTPTIGHIVNMIRENEIDTLATAWVNAHVAYLLAVRQAKTREAFQEV